MAEDADQRRRGLVARQGARGHRLGGDVRAVGTHQELLQADDLYRELVAALRIATTQPVS